MDKKDKSDQLFDLINNKMLNNYLEQFMKGLTAKVFRTFKASLTFQKELNKINLSKLDNLSPNDKINFLMSMVNQANASVATLCNHQKVMNQRFNEQVEKLEEKIKNYKQKIKKLKEKNNNKEKINNYQNKIILIKEKIQEKKSLKNISLGTSKTNYIDPRILISFAKRNNIPLEKLFTPSLLNRFKWAIDINPDFQF
jgi:DNA topoisomerase-1